MYPSNLVFLEPRSTYDKMILGISTDEKIVYDQDAIITFLAESFLESAQENGECLEKDQAYMEAVEFFDFNIAGAYMGAHTPLYVSKDAFTIALDDLS